MFSSFSSSTAASTSVVDQSTSGKAVDVISPERKDAFCEFVLSLPRKCSPTICGIIPPPPQVASINSETLLLQTTESFQNEDDEGDVPMETSSSLQGDEDEEEEGKEEDDLNEDDQELINNDSCNNSALKDSIWSIDEYSELYGGDFDNVHELEHFHEYESEQLSKHLDNESRLFFSQPSINPSPVADRRRSTGQSQQSQEWTTTNSEEENKENIYTRRSTASFIRYIDTLESMTGGVKDANHLGDDDDHLMATPTNEGNTRRSSTDPEEQQQQQQLDSGNFHETTASSAAKRTPCKQRQHYTQTNHSKMSFVMESETDSDVFSGTNTTTTMDVSFEQISLSNLSTSAVMSSGGGGGGGGGGGILLNHRCGGLSKFESHSLQIKYNEYFDFSPISPISRRTPQRAVAAGGPSAAGRTNGGGGGGGGELKGGNSATTSLRTTPGSYNDGRSTTVFKTPSSKQRVLQRTKLFNDQAFESTPTNDRLNF